jgi:cell division protein ZipA
MDDNTKKNDFLTLSIIAQASQPFASYELLQTISAAGMQYGLMNIFHYYHNKKILFSLASATEPGEFDLNNVGSLSCTGLTLFFNAATAAEPQLAFNRMLDVAEQLAEDLEGELRANPCTPWSDATLKQYQERINYYSSKKVVA